MTCQEQTLPDYKDQERRVSYEKIAIGVYKSGYYTGWHVLVNSFVKVGVEGVPKRSRLGYTVYKAMKSSPLLGTFCGSEFWGFSLLKI